MTPDAALAALGLSSPATLAEARAAFRRLVRVQHPDIAGAGSTRQAAQLTEAYAYLRRLAAAGDGETLEAGGAPAEASGPSSRSAASRSAASRSAASPSAASRPATSRPTTSRPTTSRPTPYEEAVEAELAAGDTLLVHAPPGETYAAVFEAAGRVGHVAYFDRNLGIIETIVRFEGGPSCSLLTTLQGRADGTEVFCTLDSIEAAPTPPIRPVVDALLEALRQR